MAEIWVSDRIFVCRVAMTAEMASLMCHNCIQFPLPFLRIESGSAMRLDSNETETAPTAPSHLNLIDISFRLQSIEPGGREGEGAGIDIKSN